VHALKRRCAYGAPARHAHQSLARTARTFAMRHRSERTARGCMNAKLRVQKEQIDELTERNERILEQLKLLKNAVHPSGYSTP
jgi:hypothetical protein